MNFNIWKHSKTALFTATFALLAAGMASADSVQIPAGEKTTIQGSIVSRNGDLVRVKEKKSGSIVVINLTEDTRILRNTGNVMFFRHRGMDVTAMVPGLSVNAEGVGNSKGQLDANKITFSPDEFAIEIAQEQQIMANSAAASQAQSTANSGVAAARNAQSTADAGVSAARTAQATATTGVYAAAAAQQSANAAGQNARVAGVAAGLDAAAIGKLNRRVSDLDDYKTEAVAGIYFDTGEAVLDRADRADLDKLAQIALALDGYMIEIAGFASSTGTKELNQQLSEDRATTVANYLLQKWTIPMRRIIAPAGYGSTHPDATNSDAEGRALNRRVDIAVLVNKGLNEK